MSFVVSIELGFIRSERQSYRKAADERFRRELADRILSVITARGYGRPMSSERPACRSHGRTSTLREGHLHLETSQGRLINLATGLGIQTRYFIEDEAFPAAAPPARKAA